MNSVRFNFHRRFRSIAKNPRPWVVWALNIALIRARIIDGSRTKDGNVGLAFGGIRHRIVGSCREKRLNKDEKETSLFEVISPS